MQMLVRAAPFVFVFLWATGFVGARMGMPYAEPGSFLSLRFSLAFILLALLAMFLRAPWPRPIVALQSIAVGILLHGIYLAAVFWAIDQGMPASVCAAIVCLQPILAALLAGTFLDEVVTLRNWVGMVVGLVGVILVLQPGLQFSNTGITLATIFVSFIAMGSAAFGTVLQKKIGNRVDMRTGTALQYIGAILPPFLLALLTESAEFQWNGALLFALLWLIFVLSIAAIFLLMWLIRHGSVARVSSLFFMVPAVSAVMAYGLFGEQLSLLQIAGMAISAIGVALAARAPKRIAITN